MNTCNQCNKETESKLIDLFIQLDGMPVMCSPVGLSITKVCPDCRVKAEIELRDFIKQSKYFTELEPF